MSPVRAKTTGPPKGGGGNPAKRQRRIMTPKIYEVGVDIPHAQYNELLLMLTDWFTEVRNTDAPGTLARQTVDRCLKGLTPSDGRTPWFSAANHSLAARIKQACKFDLDKMEPIRTGDEKLRARKLRQKERRLAKKREGREDGLVPDEIRKEVKNSARYGDNPLILLSSEEEKRWRELYETFQREHPHLKVASALAELELLCSLLVFQARFQLRFLKGEVIDEVKFAKIIDQIPKIKQSLDIHPNQINKRKEQSKQQGLGEAIARFESMPDWRQVRAKYWTEELLQTFQMYHSPNADGSTYQLDEVGLFGLTRCRTCHCPKCGQRNFAGMSIEEIETWLVANGKLVPLTTPIDDALAVAAATDAG